MGRKRQADEVASSNGTSGKLFSAKADFDPTLDSLFSTSLGPVSKPSVSLPAIPHVEDDEHEEKDEEDEAEEDDEVLSSLDSDAESETEFGGVEVDEDSEDVVQDEPAAARREPDEVSSGGSAQVKRKRKRKDDDLEDQYMAKLAKSEAKELAKLQAERRQKRQRITDDAALGSDMEQVDGLEMEEGSDAVASHPPQHETVSGDQPDIEKAGRTVFLANVSTDAITSKSARKTLLSHLGSILEALGAHKPPHKVESLRFRSTAFASALPKRAAFTKKELMDATTKATNAYVVYSTKEAAREAARKLNGTVVLSRHLRVDEVAHPSKTDNKRCVFVGNLGFVDDESIMQANEAEEGDKRKQKQKEPADVEEGLWREFSKVGTVESVRVVRDAKTRVGKGIAYVQFTDENAVEAALLLNEKKFPPMLPRKLRVARAKAVKRNASKKAGPSSRPQSKSVYAPKVSSQQQSLHGRAGRLFGKAGAAQMQGKGRPASGDRASKPARLGEGIKPPESFVFEGYRATGGQKPTLKMKKGKGGKPQSRSSKRGTSWKASGGKK